MLCFAAGTAFADDERKAAAQLAFDEGMALHKAGKYAQACKKFEKSMALEAAIGTRFQLAECYEKTGRLASAWKNYVAVADAAQKAGRQDRESYARERAAAIRPRLTKLRVVVPQQVSELPGLRIENNGKIIARPLWDTDVPIDPGKQRIVVTADEKKTWSKTIAVKVEGKTVIVRVPPLEPEVAVVPVAPQVPVVSEKPAPEPTPPKGDEGGLGLSGQAIAGIVVGAVGIVGMGVGLALGLTAKSRYDEAADHCNGGRCANAWLHETQSARSQGDAATAVFCIGAAAVVTGLIVWLTAPSASEPPAEARLGVGVGPAADGAGLRLVGSW